MSDIPREVLSDHFQDRLAGRRPLAAVFLTFQFEPGFFEQEVLPVLFDIPLSHGVPVRLLRLDEELRRMEGRVAVYYDRNGLVASDAGSAKLDVRRIPVSRPAGIFHPKNVLVLCEAVEPDKDGHRSQTLLVACLSANLTRAGWWENVEVCHVEEVGEDDRSRIRKDLLGLLNLVSKMAAPDTDQSALGVVQKFLRTTDTFLTRSVGNKLHPHLHVGDREALVEFLKRVAGNRLNDCYLEVISPYFDKHARSRPLERLTEAFAPREVRVMLPRNADGSAAVNEPLYRSVAAMQNVGWGHLPDELVRLGKSAEAGERFVHAKVYRFFRQSPKFEILLVGSVNLTLAAHDEGKNLETAFLFEHEPPRRPEFWLIPEQRAPREFAQGGEQDDAATRRGVPLIVRYSWNREVAELRWEGESVSPPLRLTANGVPIASISALVPAEWGRLAHEESQRLRDVLVSTSFLEVHGHGREPALILVQEEGMSHKPSLILTLSAEDILAYWAMFTEEQRLQFLEHRLAELQARSGGADLLPRHHWEAAKDTLFDRFAGMFHSFGCLSRSITEQLDRDNAREAEYRLFGKKHDSMGRLLERVLDTEDFEDPVHRYVLLLCAKQVRREVARAYPEFWSAHAADATALDEQLARIGEVRALLLTRDGEDGTKFLEWFDQMFLNRAEVAVGGE